MDRVKGGIDHQARNHDDQGQREDEGDEGFMADAKGAADPRPDGGDLKLGGYGVGHRCLRSRAQVEPWGSRIAWQLIPAESMPHPVAGGVQLAGSPPLPAAAWAADRGSIGKTADAPRFGCYIPAAALATGRRDGRKSRT